jgi:hypothetical protein
MTVLLASAVSAQISVPEARMGGMRRYFDPRPDERPLRCEVHPVKPFLGFTLRFQSGYEVRVPLSQYVGEGHRWTIAARVTPEGGQPTYFLQRFRLGKIPVTKVEAEVGGAWMLGEGGYSVAWVMIDDAGRVSRANWRISARLRRRERGIKLAIAPGTAKAFSLEVQPIPADPVATPLRLTILLHAASTSPGRTRLRTSDLFLLFTGLTSLMERLPVRSVKLVIFNLDQQRELFRRESLTSADLEPALGSMTDLQLGVVDYSVLKNRGGGIDLLAGLVEEELRAAAPSDAVILLGPAGRFGDTVPRPALDTHMAGPRFYYFQYSLPAFDWSRPFAGMRQMSMLPLDSISRMVARLQGKTIPIRTPDEFAKAVEQVARR